MLEYWNPGKQCLLSGTWKLNKSIPELSISMVQGITASIIHEAVYVSSTPEITRTGVNNYKLSIIVIIIHKDIRN